MSLALDASAVVALHFADERGPFADMEERLADGEEAFTAPNFFQEVMEALRRAVRERRTTTEDVQAWLSVLDSYNVVTVNVNPVAGCATWLIAETLNVSAHDAGAGAIGATGRIGQGGGSAAAQPKHGDKKEQPDGPGQRARFHG